MHYCMLPLGIILVLLQLQGIICSAIFPPLSYPIIVSASLSLISVIACECIKINLLVQKKQKRSFFLFILFIGYTIYFTIMGLTLLIYLSELQKGQLSLNPNLQAFLVRKQSLSFQDINWINLTYYIGSALFIGFYTRQIYKMFWVDNIIHIYRYLRKKVQHLNETVTSGLPVIPLREELKGSPCSLCLQEYIEGEQLTKLPCNHVFHRSCIRLWVIRSNACPLCRKRAIFY